MRNAATWRRKARQARQAAEVLNQAEITLSVFTGPAAGWVDLTPADVEAFVADRQGFIAEVTRRPQE